MADCKSLTDYYPFIQRTQADNGMIREDLILRNATYYSIMAAETFKAEWQPAIYDLKWVEHWPRVYHNDLYQILGKKKKV